MVQKDPDIIQFLIKYKLISREDLKIDFGGNTLLNPNSIPDPDSDLENEMNKQNLEIQEQTELNVVQEVDSELISEEEMNDQSLGLLNTPNAYLGLNFVYGFRSFDSRNNIKSNAIGNLVYFTAAIGVIFNPFENKQIMFSEHTDDISCIDVGENYAVTG